MSSAVVTSNGAAKAKGVSLADLNKPAQSVNQLSGFLSTMKNQIAAALPKHLNADRVSRLVCTEFSRNPALQKCTMKSIVGAVLTASQLGLEIGVGGQAYIIPYKDTATFVPGWKGLIDLVARAGRASVWTGAVFEGDQFEWQLGANPDLKHWPAGENDPKKMLYAYAIGKINGSNVPIIECWTNERIEKHFKKNVVPQLQDRHYANNHWEMYARKVVLLQVLKYMPQSVEIQAAVEAAHAEDRGEAVTIDADFVTMPVNENEITTETVAE